MKAFPRENTQWIDKKGEKHFQLGMDLRDYFAAKAMQALIATPKEVSTKGKKIKGSDGFAEMAYVMADAMMEARNGTA